MLARLTSVAGQQPGTDRYAEDFLSRGGCDWNKAAHQWTSIQKFWSFADSTFGEFPDAFFPQISQNSFPSPPKKSQSKIALHRIDWNKDESWNPATMNYSRGPGANWARARRTASESFNFQNLGSCVYKSADPVKRLGSRRFVLLYRNGGTEPLAAPPKTDENPPNLQLTLHSLLELQPESRITNKFRNSHT